jgi:outer membrane protein assembly factor BamA
MPSPPRRYRWLAWLGIALAAPAAAQTDAPSFAELEAAGAVIGEIRIDTRNIFDLSDPHESGIAYRAANALHAKTRPELIRRSLLFKSGDRVSVRLIEETERLIRATGTVYDVTIRPSRYGEGVVDLDVVTRDTWTLQPGLKLRHEGGKTSGAVNIKETNLAGTGTTLGFERSSTVDRNGTSFELGHDHLFDGWTAASLERSRFNDGSSESLSLARPFYALDTRWAATASEAKFNRLDSLYSAGDIVAKYRHRQEAVEFSGGVSRGLVDGWVQRYSAGLSYQSDTYLLEPGEAPPPSLPPDATRAAPFLRYEVIEDDYLPVMDRERIRRPEYFAMGLHSQVQLGRALSVLGSTDQPWLLNASLSKGFRLPAGQQLLASGAYTNQYGSTIGDVRTLSANMRWFVPQSGSYLLYFSVSTDLVRSPNIADELLLGGDSGLRGYPLRYQRGTHRQLFSVEERYYTDWYPLRLFRVGFAVYYDVGRAWDSQLGNPNNGWLNDVGIGLRVLSARSSFGNILHVDLAFPVHRTDPNIKTRQLLVMTAKTF